METFMKEFEHLKIQLQELKAATDNFDKSKIIGSGGFGKVYAGKVTLSKQGQSLVAIKRLDRKFGQGDPEFWKEIMMLSRYSHQNLISLLGYCKDAGERVLVYEHALNGSLDRHLSSTSLNWTQRIRICLDAATGLCYLHDGTGTHQRVLHRDIKSSNILLDADWNAKISDMGLSKVGPANQQYTALMTNVAGTHGYLDPMYLELGILSKESDVYSFGVVLFEVLCGRLCVEKRNGIFCSLVRMWKRSYTDNKLSTVIFQDLMQPMDPTALETFSEIAFQCLQELREDRPAMSLVVRQLKTALELQEPLDRIKIPEEYKKILKAAVPRIRYKSIEELKKVLSEGVFLNDGNTWFTLNRDEQHYQMISILACLIPLEDGNDSSRFSFPNNSRFEKLGCYSTNGKKFKTHVRTKFLSPHVTYMVNLVFRFVDSEEANKPGYLPLKYIFEGDTKTSMVYLTNKSEDEVLIARLYQFTSVGDGINVDLEFLFEDHEYCKGLDIDGIEFQPIKHVEPHQPLELEYEDILKEVFPPLNYKSVKELKLLLSNGVLLHESKTWLTLNRDEEHYQMISIVACLIPLEDGNDSSRFSFPKNSRFEKLGCYSTNGKKFKTHVRTKFLSPHVTYMVNLVFRFVGSEEANRPGYLPLKYIFEGDTKVSVVSLVDKTEDEVLIARLYQFTSDGDGINVDLEFLFEDHEYCKGLDIDGIEFQPIKNVEHHQPLEYEDILKEVIPPLNYRSMKELKLLLSNGILLHGGKTWFSINNNEERTLLTSIKECLIDENAGRYFQGYNSRFKVGTYNPCGYAFKTRVKCGSFLSPCMTYGVNLIFKCPHFSNKEQLRLQSMSIIFTSNLQGRRRSIVYIGDKREDEWVRARLYHFTTTSHPNSSIQDLEFIFEKHSYDLQVEGIEFQPLKIINAEEDEELKHDYDNIKNKYQHILQSVEGPPLIDTCVHELQLLLSKGLLVNGDNTWFHVNDKGQHCELISIKHCINSAESLWYDAHDYDSRFPVGTLSTFPYYLKVRIRPQFLTPLITYTVNLVFKFFSQNNVHPKKIVDIRLKYKLEGLEKSSLSLLAHKRELDEWWVAELCQFTSDEQGTPTPDLQITFKGCETLIKVEGIMFQPVELEKEEEHQVLEDEKVDDENEEIQPPLSSTDSDSVVDAYWEQKLPIDYEDIIKLAEKACVPVSTTKKDLYFILSKGFLINKGQEWLSIDKNGKKCLMLSPRVACVVMKYSWHFKWQSSAESRFGETMELKAYDLKIVREIGSELLTSETRYAAYLVYKLSHDLSCITIRAKVMDGRDLVSDDQEEWEKADNWYVYFDSPTSPVINVTNGKVEGNTRNPLKRPKFKDIDLPKQRGDSWKEVKIWESQTPTTTTTTTNHSIHIRLEANAPCGYLTGLIIQGIEFRPI